MSNATVTPRPQELLRSMGLNVWREAYNRGMTLSAYLESQDPSPEYKDGLDAFGRLLKAAGIRTNDMPEWGVWSDEFGAFDQSDNTRALAPEWLARQWRKATYGPANTRALYTSYDDVSGSGANPYADDPMVRPSAIIRPAINLDRLVAITTPIRGDAYRSFYLTVDTDELHMARVAEGTEIPRAKLVGGEQTIRIHKYGRALDATYEALRRQRLSRVALHIQMLAAQAEVDKVQVAVETLINGDGNSNAATTYNLTTLDSAATAGTLTLKGWLAFKMKFASPYSVDTVLAQEAIALQMLLLDVGSANVPLVSIAGQAGFGSFSQLNPGLRDNVALGWDASFPANKIVGIDTRMALERIVEIGATISEVERYITRQVQTVTMTENEGFAVFDKNATKVLVVNA